MSETSEYTPVRDRVRAFYERYPEGSIRTELVRLDERMVVFKALAYRDAGDPVPTTGWAYEPLGATQEVGAWLVGHCETAAVGRALANLDLAGGRRPSREEMEKVRRLRRDARSGGCGGRGGRAAPRRGEPAGAAAERIRALLERFELPPERRARIEAKLEAGASARELYDLEAYLLALRPARR